MLSFLCYVLFHKPKTNKLIRSKLECYESHVTFIEKCLNPFPVLESCFLRFPVCELIFGDFPFGDAAVYLLGVDFFAVELLDELCNELWNITVIDVVYNEIGQTTYLLII